MNRNLTTWRKLISEALSENNENWGNVIDTTLSDEEMGREFDDGYGGSQGAAFTLWTENYVYFPVVYDGSEWVGYVPRNPCDKASHHWGGE